MNLWTQHRLVEKVDDLLGIKNTENIDSGDHGSGEDRGNLKTDQPAVFC